MAQDPYSTPRLMKTSSDSKYFYLYLHSYYFAFGASPYLKYALQSYSDRIIIDNSISFTDKKYDIHKEYLQ